jgi:energy-coupling factor transport system ATP-binding protein
VNDCSRVAGLSGGPGEIERPANRGWLGRGRLTLDRLETLETTTSDEAREIVLKAREVTYAYPGVDALALSGVTLEIRRGEFVLLTGPSGSGKSTLLRAFLGLVPHLYGGEVLGEVTALGQDVSTTLPHRLAPRVGMVFQNPEDQLLASAVEADVAFGPENLGVSRDEVVARTERALARAGVVHLRRRSVHELSVGQQQRVALAGALALEPEVLLLDEPTSQVDPRSAAALLSNLHQLNRETGLTIVLAEHRLELALPLADRLVVMADGRVAQDGPTRKVVEQGRLASLGVGLPRVVELSQAVPLGEEISLSVGEVVGRVEARLGGTRRSTPRIQVGEEVRTRPSAQLPGRADGCSTALIAVRGLRHVYPNGVEALRGVELQIAPGEAVALLGQSGAGKTTLALHLIGLLRPAAGQVAVAGQDTARTPVSRLAATVGYVFQNPLHQLFAESVADELALGPKALGWTVDEVAARVEELLARFGFERYRTRHPLTLSEGERRRVALAATLASRPRVVIMDEPTVGQDRGEKLRLGRVIGQLLAEDRAVVVITHDIEFAADYCPRFVVMAEGTVLADGPRSEVLDQPEVLAAAGLEPPQLFELGMRLADWGFDRDARTLPAARRELVRLLGEG